MLCPKCNTANDNNSLYCKQCALPLSEYYEATQGFKPSFPNLTVAEEQQRLKPDEEVKIQSKIEDKKEKGSRIIWLLMWEMVTWILWFFLNDFLWATDFKGENPQHYINIANLCSGFASMIAVIITSITLAKANIKREKAFLSIYGLVRLILMLLFTYRFLIDV